MILCLVFIWISASGSSSRYPWDLFWHSCRGTNGPYWADSHEQSGKKTEICESIFCSWLCTLLYWIVCLWVCVFRVYTCVLCGCMKRVCMWVWVCRYGCVCVCVCMWTHGCGCACIWFCVFFVVVLFHVCVYVWLWMWWHNLCFLQSTDESVRVSAPRISMATLKAQERRRRAQYPFGPASVHSHLPVTRTSPLPHCLVVTGHRQSHQCLAQRVISRTWNKGLGNCYTVAECVFLLRACFWIALWDGSQPTVPHVCNRRM